MTAQVAQPPAIDHAKLFPWDNPVSKVDVRMAEGVTAENVWARDLVEKGVSDSSLLYLNALISLCMLNISLSTDDQPVPLILKLSSILAPPIAFFDSSSPALSPYRSTASSSTSTYVLIP